ncbi:hypothetical protein JQ595_16525 [Bradyrhizobium japonicum]|uniref:hypothetical protein n=1 Tax=Bradyrhizobium japonicum TaxID=375 RepID=UPI001BA52630|nr:hypothetical protein [Bradyrhizobium japonicum]MBR0730358.1 hypothetical protein [Bradyrhizobium japonicum]
MKYLNITERDIPGGGSSFRCAALFLTVIVTTAAPSGCSEHEVEKRRPIEKGETILEPSLGFDFRPQENEADFTLESTWCDELITIGLVATPR